MNAIQAKNDRLRSEHHRLVTTPLPDGWLRIAMDAGFPGLPGDMAIEEAERRVQAIINSILPLHEQLLRAQIAKEVRHAGPTRTS